MDSSVKVEVHLDSIKHNFALAKSRCESANIMAVVKADAYGHGLKAVYSALEREPISYAVATVQEGIALRDFGCRQPITVLSRLTSPACLKQGLAAKLTFVLHVPEHVAWYEQAHRSRSHDIDETATVTSPTVWLKLDAGMHRLGLDPQQYETARALLLGRLSEAEIGVMAHFSSADQPSDPATSSQLREFERVTCDHSGPRSIANSAALLSRPDTHLDLARPGLMLFGASPLLGESAQSLGLRPAMTVSANIIAVRSVSAGSAVGYGGTWSAQHDTSVAVVGIGYGDGYPRAVKSGSAVVIDGARYPVVGRVSMDSITVDLGPSGKFGIGESVELWGQQLSVNEIASCADTIAYELMTRMSVRQPTRTCGKA